MEDSFVLLNLLIAKRIYYVVKISFFYIFTLEEVNALKVRLDLCQQRVRSLVWGLTNNRDYCGHCLFIFLGFGERKEINH